MDTAGDDGVEQREVDVDVERHPVHRAPRPLDHLGTDPHGCDLRRPRSLDADPHPGMAFESPHTADIIGIEKRRDSGDDGILHTMGVRRDGGQVIVERHDGVGHQLAGPMRADRA